MWLSLSSHPTVGVEGAPQSGPPTALTTGQGLVLGSVEIFWVWVLGAATQGLPTGVTLKTRPAALSLQGPPGLREHGWAQRHTSQVVAKSKELVAIQLSLFSGVGLSGVKGPIGAFHRSPRAKRGLACALNSCVVGRGLLETIKRATTRQRGRRAPGPWPAGLRSCLGGYGKD